MNSLTPTSAEEGLLVVLSRLLSLSLSATVLTCSVLWPAMDDDDAAEMAALRQSRQYQHHAQHFQSRDKSHRQQHSDDESDDATREQRREGEDDDDNDEAAAMRAFLPAAFGASKAASKPSHAAASSDSHAAHRRSTAPHDAISSTAATAATEHRQQLDDIVVKRETPTADVSSSPPSVLDPFNLPITHSLTIPASTKSTPALAVSLNHTRLATGSLDSVLRLYDFNSATAAFNPHRTLTPTEGQPVHCCLFDTAGRVLCSGSGATIHLYDRDGRLVLETVRGDGYLLDQSNTKGHTAAVCDIRWLAGSTGGDGLFGSCGRDGVVRLWDVSWKAGRECKEVIKMRGGGGRAGGGMAVSSLCFSQSGELMVAACTDGAARIFHRAGTRWSERQLVKAMTASSGVTSEWISDCQLMSDDRRLLMRSREAITMHDLRMVREPLGRVALGGQHEQSDMAVSPDEKLVLATSDGNLAFLSTAAAASPAVPLSTSTASSPSSVTALSSSLSLLSLLPLSPRPLIRVLYPAALNQIFVSSATGSVHALYSPTLSHKGVLLSATRPVKTRPLPPDAAHQQPVGPIINPHGMPVWPGENRGKKRRQDVLQLAVDEEADDSERWMPLPPVSKGEGGRMATSTNMTQFMMRKIVQKKMDVREVDPREALLAMEEKIRASGDKRLFTGAYDKTQPKPIFRAAEEDEEEDDGKT